MRCAPHTVLDVITSRRRLAAFGPDETRLDLALTRVAIAGFSDGATYALSLGLANGDLFRRIVAFSPGFVVDGERQGQPQIFERPRHLARQTDAAAVLITNALNSTILSPRKRHTSQ